jgi:catechol 2,3-dioxygenase-like lactoylglutathione lyase family enzyme
MELGAFSVSLAVKDLKASLAFYEKLGFAATGGSVDQNYMILKNGTTIIGLFQGMFEKNILTFNPGWNNDAQEVNPFTDVRALQKQLREQGVTLNETADEGSAGPAHITLTDPDGNAILIDQHR